MDAYKARVTAQMTCSGPVACFSSLCTSPYAPIFMPRPTGPQFKLAGAMLCISSVRVGWTIKCAN